MRYMVAAIESLALLLAAVYVLNGNQGSPLVDTLFAILCLLIVCQAGYITRPRKVIRREDRLDEDQR